MHTSAFALKNHFNSFPFFLINPKKKKQIKNEIKQIKKKDTRLF